MPRDLQFGPLTIGFPVVQAALSGYSDWPMRMIARQLGAQYALCEVMLDQFLVAKGIAKKSGKYVLNENGARLEVYNGMISGSYNTPVRFGQKSPNLNGYSDHLPISMVIGEK